MCFRGPWTPQMICNFENSLAFSLSSNHSLHWTDWTNLKEVTNCSKTAFATKKSVSTRLRKFKAKKILKSNPANFKWSSKLTLKKKRKLPSQSNFLTRTVRATWTPSLTFCRLMNKKTVKKCYSMSSNSSPSSSSECLWQRCRSVQQNTALTWATLQSISWT